MESLRCHDRVSRTSALHRFRRGERGGYAEDRAVAWVTLLPTDDAGLGEES